MADERSRTRPRPTAADSHGESDLEPLVDPAVDSDRDTPTTRPAEEAGDGLGGRLGRRATAVFSPRVFLVSLALVLGGLWLVGTLLSVPFSGWLGVLIGTFLLGLASEHRRYAEGATAGGIAGVASTFIGIGILPLSLLGVLGLPFVAIAGLIGAAVGGLGVYFGRDLRDGLTREVGTGP